MTSGKKNKGTEKMNKSEVTADNNKAVLSIRLPKKYEEEISRFPPEEQEKLRKRYFEMLYDIGEAIGMVAAHSISEPATQTTLRAYHAEGRVQLVTTKGLPRLIEIFDARKVPSTPSMTIYLDEEHNNKEAARKIAAEIRETNLEQIMKEDSLNLMEMKVEIVLDENKLAEINMTAEEVARILKKNLRNVDVKVEDKNKISLESKKGEVNLRDLQTIRIKARTIHIKGIKGITQVIVEKDEDDWIIRTLGTNLKKVLTMDGVDPRRTKSNHIFEVMKVLGVEAARNLIVEETLKTLREQGVDTDERHVMLIADIMTFSGVVKPIGRYGIAGEKASVLAKANFEETIKHLTNAAAKGEVDDLKSIFANVIVGNLPPIGTGMFRLGLKEDGE